MRDALRDEDDEDERRQEDPLRGSQSSATSYLDYTETGQHGSLSSTVVSQSTSPDADVHLQGLSPSLLASRRGTVDSTATSSSDDPLELPPDEPSEDSTLEIMAAASNASHQYTFQSSVPSIPNTNPSRHSSKGGAISGAAAAAAGKLGLHRPKMKINIRPSTANTVIGQGWSNRSQSTVTTPTVELEGFGNWKVASKRPSTATNNGASRNTLMRVYRNDGTHTVITLALTSTTTDLRSILSRKSMDSTAKRLFVRDKGSERPLGESEKPAMLQRRRFEQAGYTAPDGLDELGREDMSYLLKCHKDGVKLLWKHGNRL
jgi:adenylate cyclase